VNNFYEKALFSTENFWAGMKQAIGLALGSVISKFQIWEI